MGRLICSMSVSPDGFIPGPDGDIGIGGATLAASFIALGLIDEYELFVCPMILSAARPTSSPATISSRNSWRPASSEGGSPTCAPGASGSEHRAGWPERRTSAVMWHRLLMPIRMAEPERDAGACAAIYAPYVRDTAISFEEVPPSAGEMADRMAGILPTHPWLVAEQGGEVIGYAYASPHRDRAAYRWTADAAVYVHGDHHREGVGRRLYGDLFDRLRRQGFRTVCAGITLPNDGSVGLHTALGFAPVGVYRGVGWKAGAWRDVGWWQLDLGDGRPGPPSGPSSPAP